MAQYVSGSSALRIQQMPYDPVSFKRIRFEPQNCQFHVLQADNGNVLFELHCDETPVIAFLFYNLHPWEIKQRREAFSRLFVTGKDGSSLIAFTVLPTQHVAKLPLQSMWQISSPLGEDLFWASEALHMNVCSAGNKIAVIELNISGIPIASFHINGMECDDEEILDAAIKLRHTLHMKHQIRVASKLDHQQIVWFIPARIS